MDSGSMHEMAGRMAEADGFIAALDQSGGSTPGALRDYGVPPEAYEGEAAMFEIMHEMRERVMTAPSFSGDKVIGAILFVQTMDGTAAGKPVPEFLWRERRIVPFLKIDKGMEAEQDGVQLMKPIPGLDALLERAGKLGVYGTKMRSVIRLASPDGVAAIVAQQFEVAEQIAGHGLMPIIEPEVLIKSPEKAAAEGLLRDALTRHLDRLPEGRKVMLKLTIPSEPDFYAELVAHPGVARLVALSGGYPQAEACALLAKNHGLIGSFSRALLVGLQRSMSDAEFDAALGRSIDAIYTASTAKP